MRLGILIMYLNKKNIWKLENIDRMTWLYLLCKLSTSWLKEEKIIIETKSVSWWEHGTHSINDPNQVD